MKYNELQTTAFRNRKRVGRGIAAGQGKTAGRGTKGQKSRTGKGRRPGFEGGQNPLSQRLPKLRGFGSYRVPTENVYTGQLDKLGVTVDNQALADAGVIEHAYSKVKLIVRGDVTKKHTVKLQLASEGAVVALQNAGGTFEVSPQVLRPKTSTKTKKTEK